MKLDNEEKKTQCFEEGIWKPTSATITALDALLTPLVDKRGSPPDIPFLGVAPALLHN